MSSSSWCRLAASWRRLSMNRPVIWFRVRALSWLASMASSPLATRGSSSAWMLDSDLQLAGEDSEAGNAGEPLAQLLLPGGGPELARGVVAPGGGQLAGADTDGRGHLGQGLGCGPDRDHDARAGPLAAPFHVAPLRRADPGPGGSLAP